MLVLVFFSSWKRRQNHKIAVKVCNFVLVMAKTRPLQKQSVNDNIKLICNCKDEAASIKRLVATVVSMVLIIWTTLHASCLHACLCWLFLLWVVNNPVSEPESKPPTPAKKTLGNTEPKGFYAPHSQTESEPEPKYPPQISGIFGAFFISVPVLQAIGDLEPLRMWENHC